MSNSFRKVLNVFVVDGTVAQASWAVVGDSCLRSGVCVLSLNVFGGTDLVHYFVDLDAIVDVIPCNLVDVGKDTGHGGMLTCIVSQQ